MAMADRLYLNKYRSERFLGEGGMSRVYLGKQLKIEREIVLKVLRDELVSNPTAVEHFRREIHIHSRFEHPRAVTFIDGDADGKLPLLVLEYLRGLDLADLLAQEGRLDIKRTGRLLGQLCEVVHACHEAGMVHRDLKPSNVMIQFPQTAVEKVKLMDFGLAKMSALYYLTPAQILSIHNPTACGTPEYISPEQARGHDVDRKSDIYTLGVMLYEMLTGRRPFIQTDVEGLLSAHLSETPPDFGSLGLESEIPFEIEKLVFQCLAKYPEERPPTAEEVAVHYEQALGMKLYQNTSNGSRVNSKLTGSVSQDQSQKLRELAEARNNKAFVQHIKASMVESMAMLKVKGFIHDLGGQIVETTPGMIKVELQTGSSEGGGLLGWLTGKKASSSTLQLELRMETPDPARPGDLDITMLLRNGNGSLSTETRAKCERIGRELQAYLR